MYKQQYIYFGRKRRTSKMYKERLLQLGVPANLKGFTYLNDMLMAYEPGCKITLLYDKVGKSYGEAGSRVERSCRHAVQKLDLGLTNGEFIANYKVVHWADIEKGCGK